MRNFDLFMDTPVGPARKKPTQQVVSGSKNVNLGVVETEGGDKPRSKTHVSDSKA